MRSVWEKGPFFLLGVLLRIFVVAAILGASSAWAACPSGKKSTAVASPTSVIADGVATSTITVTVRDGKNKVQSGVTVTLTAGSGSSTITGSPATTNSSGVATFTVKDAVVESVTYTARASAFLCLPVTVQQKPVVNFVRAAPTVAKSFSPASIAANATSTLAITLTNPNTSSITGVTFNDTYPANLVNAGTPAASSTCGGTVTASPGGGLLALSGGTIPASGSCTVSVTVTSATAGSYVNNTGAVTSSNALAGTSASATLAVTAISASLSTVVASPTTVLANGVATSTITVTLRDGAGQAVSGKTVTLTKSGGSSTISAASGPSDANGVVTFTVKDTVAETTTYTAKDTTDNITVSQTAAVTFVKVPILKSFATSPIAANGTSTLTVALSNSSGSPITGAGFTDTYPAGLVNASGPSASGCGAGVVSGTAGGNTLGMTNATIAANSTCTVSVAVTAATAGTYVNTATNTASQTSTASLVVTAISPTSSTVSASPASVAADGTSTSTITVTLKDGAGNPVSGKAVSLSAGAGSSTISAASGPSDANGKVTFTVKDTIAEGPITYTATDTTDGITITGTASVTFTRISAPTVTKSFTPATIADAGTTTLAITLTNPNAAAISGVAFTDAYPADLVNTSSLVLSNTCGGSNPGTAASGTTLALTGGTIPASGSCTVSVQVTATTLSSSLVNSTSAVTSSNATSGTAASATLNVVDVSAANSTVVASPTSVPADGATTSTITVTLMDGGGNPVEGKVVSLAASGGSSIVTAVSATTDALGVATFTVRDAVPETVTYTATDATDGIVITQQAAVTFSVYVGNFDAVEVGAAKATRLYTKRSGVDFPLDILALTSGGAVSTGYSGTVSIKMVDASSGSCAAMPVLKDFGTYTFTGAGAGKDNGRKTVTFNYASATPNARIRVADTSLGITACSSDNFVVRPPAVALNVSPGMAAPPSASATPTIKAGTSFTLTATTSPAAGYAGTLTLDTGKLTAQITTQDTSLQSGGVVGTLTPATLTANAAASNNAGYSEVGYLYLAPGAFRDDNYTSIDQPSGCAATNSCDCVTDTTGDANLADTAVSGKYGCSIGNTVTYSFGRFTPDHFAVTPGSVTHRADIAACSASTFTYLGEDFKTGFTLTAQNFANATTLNYTGVFARLGLTAWSNFGFAASGLPAGSSLQAGSAAPSGVWSNGAASVVATHAVSRPASRAAPASVTVTAAPVDGDGVTMTAAAVYSSAAPMRFGRLRMSNAYGSELLDLPIPIQIQYWSVSAFVTNGDDNCSTLASSSVALGNYQKNLNSGETSVSPNPIVFTNGVGSMKLTKPGAGNGGSVDLAVDLGATTSPNICPTWTPTSPPTAANMAYLRGNWCGSSYDRDPTARATFGIYKGGPMIYMRESY